MFKFKVGDTVKIIDIDGDRKAIRGELCKVLKIEDEYLGATAYITVSNSRGIIYGMFAKRFALAEKKVIKQYGIVAFMKETNAI